MIAARPAIITSRRSPTRISGLQLWLDAETLDLINNDSIQTWPDMSKNNFDAVQATSNLRPLYKTSIQNGRPVVRFDGTDDFMSVPHNDLLQGPEFTVFVIGMASNLAGSIKFIEKPGTPSTPYILFGRGATSDLLELNFGTTSDSVVVVNSATTIMDGIFRLYGARRETAADEGRLFINGASVGSATDTTTVSANNTNVVNIGAHDGANGPSYDIGEIVFYNRALTAAERGFIDNYLMDKWGL